MVGWLQCCSVKGWVVGCGDLHGVARRNSPQSVDPIHALPLYHSGHLVKTRGTEAIQREEVCVYVCGVCQDRDNMLLCLHIHISQVFAGYFGGLRDPPFFSTQMSRLTQ